jgi:ipoprotein LpqH
MPNTVPNAGGPQLLGKGAQVKRELTVALAGVAILAAGISGCSDNKTGTGAASGTKLTIDGKDQNVSGASSCVTSNGTINIAAGGAATGIGAVITDANPPQVKSVGLGSSSGMALAYSSTGGGGDATATKDGKSIKITGHVVGIDTANPMQQANKPFELDVTCP